MKALLLLLVAIPLAAYGHEPSTMVIQPNFCRPFQRLRGQARRDEAIEAGKGARFTSCGSEHGFKNLPSFHWTAPGGGPPLHTHESEEAHVLTSGTMSYVRRSILLCPPRTFFVFLQILLTPSSMLARRHWHLPQSLTR